VLRVSFNRRIEIHADFIVIYLIAFSDHDCHRAIAFTNSTAIVYSNARRPAYVESAGLESPWVIKHWIVEHRTWVAIANAHAIFIACRATCASGDKR
jgi:hypothetical protein